MGLSRDAGWSAPLAATVDHIWGGDERLVVLRNGEQREKWVPIERYRLAPSAKRARFLLPTTSRRAAASSIRSYNQLRLRGTREARQVLGAVVAAGGGALLRDSLQVVVDPTLPPAMHGQHVLTAFLREAIGDPSVGFGVGVHDQTPNSKPTLQAFASDGSPRGFIKVGWNDVTRAQVATEAAALEHLSRTSAGLATPDLHYAGQWRDRMLLVTAPMPLSVQRWEDTTRSPDLAVVSGLARSGRTDTTDVGLSACVKDLTLTAQNAAWDADIRRSVLALLTRISRQFGSVPLTFGAWHGDWVPWNVARHDGGLIAWDWEQFRDGDVPIGLDTVHWHFQVCFVLNGDALGVALRNAHERSRADLEQMHGPGTAALCHALYALQLTARYEDMRAAGAGSTARFHSDIIAELDGIGREW